MLAFLNILVIVFVLALVVGLLIYLLDSAPFVSASIKPHARWVLIAIAVIAFLVLLVNWLGGEGVPRLIG